MRVAVVVASCFALSLYCSGCVAWTHVNGVKPTYPTVGILDATVDSLQPELKWESESAGQLYDLAIWNTIKVDDVHEPRKIIYERYGLSGNAHKIEIMLEPDGAYFWSVRKSASVEWSDVSVHFISVLGSGKITRMFYFKTPGKGAP